MTPSCWTCSDAPVRPSQLRSVPGGCSLCPPAEQRTCAQVPRVGTRSLFGVAAVARRAGFALTPHALLRHQALWGSTWVGGYRRHLWRELLLPVDISALRLFDLQVRRRCSNAVRTACPTSPVAAFQVPRPRAGMVLLPWRVSSGIAVAGQSICWWISLLTSLATMPPTCPLACSDDAPSPVPFRSGNLVGPAAALERCHRGARSGAVRAACRSDAPSGGKPVIRPGLRPSPDSR